MSSSFINHLHVHKSTSNHFNLRFILNKCEVIKFHKRKRITVRDIIKQKQRKTKKRNRNYKTIMNGIGEKTKMYRNINIPNHWIRKEK